MSNELTTTHTLRHYHNYTSEQLAEIDALAVLLGNRSAAIRQLYPMLLQPRNAAFKTKKKSKLIQTEVFIDDQLQQIGVDAVNRLGEAVHSPDEKTAVKVAMYAIDHIRGQATKKSINVSVRRTIQDVLT